VSFGVRVAVKINVQLPVAMTPRDPLQLWPALAVTVTLPVGTPTVPVTEKFTVTTLPTAAGLGVLEVIFVVLVSVFTVIETEPFAVT
jgi:hypothetical protein